MASASPSPCPRDVVKIMRGNDSIRTRTVVHWGRDWITLEKSLYNVSDPVTNTSHDEDSGILS